MKMYDTVTEAVEILRETWRGRTYTIESETTGKRVTGSAYDIYSEVLACELSGNKDHGYWTVHENSAEECALMEAIYATLPYCGRALQFDFERAALEVLNSIVAEVEDN